MTFEEWSNEVVNSEKFYELQIESFYSICESAWNHQQAKINHIKEYLMSGMQVAPENSEYWLALRDCLNEIEGIEK